jgi:hypothetical protein
MKAPVVRAPKITRNPPVYSQSLLILLVAYAEHLNVWRPIGHTHTADTNTAVHTNHARNRTAHRCKDSFLLFMLYNDAKTISEGGDNET